MGKFQKASIAVVCNKCGHVLISESKAQKSPVHFNMSYPIKSSLPRLFLKKRKWLAE